MSTLRSHLESLRRQVDASSMFFEPTRNTPRALLERIRCHPGDLHSVHLIVHDVNPWDGPIEVASDVPRGRVEVSWLTPGRVPRTALLTLN